MLQIHLQPLRGVVDVDRLQPPRAEVFELVWAALGAGALNWTITQVDEPTFRFDWIESGGPPVREPTASGFGSRLIRNTLAGLGEVHMRYPPEGFRLEFAGPVAELTHIVVPEFEAAWDTAH